MKELQKEKFKVLAEVYGWSPDYAKGFVDGEISRLRGKKPSEHALIGIDEYCLGFRAGYYERNLPGLTRHGRPDAPDEVLQQSSRRS